MLKAHKFDTNCRIDPTRFDYQFFNLLLCSEVRIVHDRMAPREFYLSDYHLGTYSRSDGRAIE